MGSYLWKYFRRNHFPILKAPHTHLIFSTLLKKWIEDVLLLLKMKSHYIIFVLMLLSMNIISMNIKNCTSLTLINNKLHLKLSLRFLSSCFSSIWKRAWSCFRRMFFIFHKAEIRVARVQHVVFDYSLPIRLPYFELYEMLGYTAYNRGANSAAHHSAAKLEAGSFWTLSSTN